ncbi:MAG: NAD(P)H-hydrate dehydratase [Bacteroidetes bacterium]|nr:NAD(P)H-hydrate dehydratase [Bacteroidota bacterium]
MKILPAELIRQADAYTMEHEPIRDIDLMERAASKCTEWLINYLRHEHEVHVFCGSGNNGGDGLVIARLLRAAGVKVKACLVETASSLSASNQINLDRLRHHYPDILCTISHLNDIPTQSDDIVIIDALFGSGLNKPVTGFVADIIRRLNDQQGVIIAVDVPSGLFIDRPTQHKTSAVIKADYTLTFSPPKLAFFFPENDASVGHWQLLDIGIMKEFTDQCDVPNFMLEAEMLKGFRIQRNKFSHKGHFGHALIIAGSYGKIGAAVLASRACLRSGSGLVTAHVPRSGVPIIQTAVPEAMVHPDADDLHLTGIPVLDNYQAIAVGPGIGTEKQTANTLKLLIQNSPVPLVMDADALNILAGHKTWMAFLPKNTILTPHPKEFERIAGKSSNDFERNKTQRDLSVKYQVFVVLKGAHTAITCPDGSCYFNTTGNPGMATGGSGDVLTGILAGLLAQHYTPLAACLFAVYLHGLAGDMAASVCGQESLIAGDIIENLGKAFLAFEKSTY